MGDLLPIRAELPDDNSEQDDASSDGNDQSANARFTSQLFLFEAVGCICSSHAIPPDNQAFLIRSVITPLFSDLEAHLNAAKAGDERAVLQINHLIMALGTLAHGFRDWTPGSASSMASPLPAAVSEEFVGVAEAILIALEALKSSFEVRTAARFAFSRLMGVLGNRVLPQLPRWIGGFFSQTSTKDEMALFLRLLDQVVFGFKTEISGVLEALVTPLLERVLSEFMQPATGTDDEIQMAELKREYLSFLMVVFNSGLEGVLLSDSKLLHPAYRPSRMLTL